MYPQRNGEGKGEREGEGVRDEQEAHAGEDGSDAGRAARALRGQAALHLLLQVRQGRADGRAAEAPADLCHLRERPCHGTRGLEALLEPRRARPGRLYLRPQGGREQRSAA